MFGSLETSLLPSCVRFEREKSPDAVERVEHLRKVASVLPYVVCRMTPFYTPDGWDYDWTFYLCPDEKSANYEAELQGMDGSVATVSKLVVCEFDNCDHEHTPEWGIRLCDGETIRIYVDGKVDTSGRNAYDIMGV